MQMFGTLYHPVIAAGSAPFVRMKTVAPIPHFGQLAQLANAAGTE
jgi:hypothetical protein